MQKLIILCCLAALLPVCSHAQTFAEFFKQKKTQKKYLLEQIAKLQLYMGQLKKGYDLAKDGLTAVGNIKNGDFSLHGDFFNHLKNVSPAVQTYSKAVAIVSMQQQAFSLYKDYRRWFTVSDLLTGTEQDYCFTLLANMLEEIGNQVTDLIRVLTGGQLEMNDQQRLEQIDHIYMLTFDTKTALQSFITDITQLIQSRKQNTQDTEDLRLLTTPQ